MRSGHYNAWMTLNDQRRQLCKEIVNIDVRLIKATDRVSRAVDDATFNLITGEIGLLRNERAAKRLKLQSL